MSDMTWTPPRVPTVDRVQTEARAASFTTRSIKKAAKVQALELAIRMTDLTTLAGADTAGKVDELCRKALQPAQGTPRTAAVCVYPPFVAQARQHLDAGQGDGARVAVAAVATYFPSGQAEWSMREAEVRQAVADGADEIDMVISRRAFLEGNYFQVYDEIVRTKAACGDARLKVILETGELETLDNVRLASEIAIEAGADFIKTSTGKVEPAATMPVTLVMLQTIRDHYRKTGKRVGMKPAGGIRTAKEAIHYLVMVNETLGDEWLDPTWFRFGASSLLNDLLLQWQKEQSGRYQASWSLSTTGAY